MKTSLSVSSLLALVLLVAAPGASAQSIGRMKKSLDKATGGATQTPARPGQPSTPTATTVAVDPQAVARAQAQAAAAEALAKKRNQASQVGVDQRVVDFLKQRIEDGSADAPFDLAKRYEEGQGVNADPVEARRLYALAAERGNEEAKTWIEAHPEPEKAEKVEKSETAAKPDKAVNPAPPVKSVPPAKPEK